MQTVSHFEISYKRFDAFPSWANSGFNEQATKKCAQLYKLTVSNLEGRQLRFYLSFVIPAPVAGSTTAFVNSRIFKTHDNPRKANHHLNYETASGQLGPAGFQGQLSLSNLDSNTRTYLTPAFTLEARETGQITLMPWFMNDQESFNGGLLIRGYAGIQQIFTRRPAEGEVLPAARVLLTPQHNLLALDQNWYQANEAGNSGAIDYSSLDFDEFSTTLPLAQGAALYTLPENVFHSSIEVDGREIEKEREE